MLRRLFLALLAFGAVPAVGAGISGVRRGETLQAGESRVVRVADGVANDEPGEETELVLSLDGGRTFALRVSREVDARDDGGAFLFTVPNLPSPRVVLGLRTGREGEDERVVAVSEPFVVVAAASTPLEPLRTVRGELATREASGAGHGEEPGAGVEPVDPSFVAATDAPDLEDADGSVLEAPPPSAAPFHAAGRPVEALRPRVAAEALPPPFRPRRE